ncbi:Cdc6/Cdc18 family protein [Archaeoglobus profundus]|uniref:Cdc6-related protein AAA superfamily ATPase-like protein n=1 Tax=Archaeoglobus profundus (strain DSM 5631 / JCM 9629 / NBRC 100127 / Av18) TaxID=572546 RepID=D2RDM7_ARCPA|nr:cell division protein Cdc6 [Archaeoglobus profundus]ADB58221.1 Cdc6-related protein AAA superfamily ATPase- like protein [Archaeoglobus profundus DSM 5631]
MRGNWKRYDKSVERFVKLLEMRKELEARIFKARGWSTYLSYDYLPQNPKYRVEEVVEISSRISDLIRNRVTGNLIIHGGPGTGKTMSFLIAKRVVEDYLKEEGVKDYEIVYVVARGKWSALLYSICRYLGLDVPERGISLLKYFELIEGAAEESYLHICIDNFDTLLQQEPKVRARATTEQMLHLMTKTPNMSFTIITSRVNLIKEIADSSVLSLLDTLNAIYFKPYTFEQCKNILLERVRLVFADGVFDEEALDVLAFHVAREGGDIRRGLNLLRFCGEYLVKKGLTRVDSELIKHLIDKYDVRGGGQQLIDALSLSDKLVLVAIYQLMKELGSDVVHTNDVFERQDYYHRVMGLPSIGKNSFSTYLTRLSTLGVIEIKRKRGWGARSPKVFVRLNCPSNAVKYLIENDPDLGPVREVLMSSSGEGGGSE